jgi:hypothetical protein
MAPSLQVVEVEVEVVEVEEWWRRWRSGGGAVEGGGVGGGGGGGGGGGTQRISGTARRRTVRKAPKQTDKTARA